MSTRQATHRPREEVGELRIVEVEEVLKRSIDMVRREVSVDTVKRLLFNRDGELYAYFP